MCSYSFRGNGNLYSNGISKNHSQLCREHFKEIKIKAECGTRKCFIIRCKMKNIYRFSFRKLNLFSVRIEMRKIRKLALFTWETNND